MNDPNQVIDQIGRYRAEGRLEIAEVMAQELTMYLQHDKDRDIVRDAILVRAYRQLAGILQERQRWKGAAAAVKQLVRCRLRHCRRASKEEREDLRVEAAEQAARDEILAAGIAIGRGRCSAAVGHCGNSIKLDPDDIEPYILCLEAFESCKRTLRKRDRYAKRLAKRIESAGPVNRLDGVMVLQPREHGPRCDAQRLNSALVRFCAEESGLGEAQRLRLAACRVAVESQIASIESGEQAADARLAAAVEKLQPTMDYHAYSKSV